MYRRRCTKCNMNNNCLNNVMNLNTLKVVSNVESILSNNTTSCDCGFDKEDNVFPENPVLGQSYVPIQQMGETFIPSVGLKKGTIFPELFMPYSPCQSMEEIAFIKAMNTVKEGCNKC